MTNEGNRPAQIKVIYTKSVDFRVACVAMNWINSRRLANATTLDAVRGTEPILTWLHNQIFDTIFAELV